MVAFVFGFVFVLGFEFRVSHLPGKCLVFEIGSQVFARASLGPWSSSPSE
jgi:hypothetical protein